MSIQRIEQAEARLDALEDVDQKLLRMAERLAAHLDICPGSTDAERADMAAFVAEVKARASVQ